MSPTTKNLGLGLTASPTGKLPQSDKGPGKGRANSPGQVKRSDSSGGAVSASNEADGVVTTVQRNTTQSFTSGAWTAPSWSSAVTDALGAWSAGAPTLITVPSGKTGVEVIAEYTFNNANVTQSGARLSLNSAVVEYQTCLFNQGTLITRRLAVSPGDVLLLELVQVTFNNSAQNLYDGVTPTYFELRWF